MPSKLYMGIYISNGCILSATDLPISRGEKFPNGIGRSMSEDESQAFVRAFSKDTWHTPKSYKEIHRNDKAEVIKIYYLVTSADGHMEADESLLWRKRQGCMARIHWLKLEDFARDIYPMNIVPFKKALSFLARNDRNFALDNADFLRRYIGSWVDWDRVAD